MSAATNEQPDRHLVQGRGHLRGPRPGLQRQERRWHRRLCRAHRQARLPAGSRRHRALAAAVLSVAVARRRLRHRRLHRRQSRLRHARRRPAARQGGAQARPPRHHRAGHQPHLRPASLVPARAPRQAGQRGAQLLRLERHARALPRGADHLQGLRDLQLDLGPGRRRLLTGTASTPTSPTSTTTTRRSSRRSSRCSTSGSRWASTALRLDAVPYLFEREGTNCENLPETHAVLKQLRRHLDETAPGTACCSPRPTSGRRTRSPTSATATSATWRSTSRSCRGCSWRSTWRTASRSSTSWPRRRRSPTTASGRSSCATTTS